MWTQTINLPHTHTHTCNIFDKSDLLVLLSRLYYNVPMNPYFVSSECHACEVTQT